MKDRVLYILVFMGILFSQSLAQNGLVKTYFRNGELESEIFYVKDAIDGTAKWYYENGVLKQEVNFMLGKLNGWVRTFYENSAPKEEYYVKDGRLDGLYKVFYDNGGVKSITTFENGLKKDKKTFAFDKTLLPPKIEPALKKEESVQVANNETVPAKNSAPVSKRKIIQAPKDGLKIDENEEELFFMAVEESPEPIGGMAAIMDKIKYPALAKQAKVEGEVIVRAYVNEIGMVTGTQIVKGIGLGCDEVALNAVKSTPFRPGKQRGKPVKVQLNIPIKFTLSKSS